MTELVRYDAMCRAIAECHSVDEVKGIRDKAVALELYLRQAKDFDGERRCIEIRSRAEKQAGVLLREREMASGTRGQLAGRDSSGDRQSRPPEDQPPTLAELGITKDESSRFQRLADVPDETFEEAIADPAVKPTPAKIIARHKAKNTPPEKEERSKLIAEYAKAVNFLRKHPWPAILGDAQSEYDAAFAKAAHFDHSSWWAEARFAEATAVAAPAPAAPLPPPRVPAPNGAPPVDDGLAIPAFLDRRLERRRDG